jgi:hypothetical protein
MADAKEARWPLADGRPADPLRAGRRRPLGRDGGQQRARLMPRRLGRVLLLLAVAALALLASQLLGDGSIASSYSCAYGVSVEQCLAGPRRAALALVTAAVVAAHVVILVAIVATAWLLSQPPSRHRQELRLRRRAWSGLAVAVALVALFFWSLVAQQGVIVDRFVEY